MTITVALSAENAIEEILDIKKASQFFKPKTKITFVLPKGGNPQTWTAEKLRAYS